jgi:hypothetical protein
LRLGNSWPGVVIFINGRRRSKPRAVSCGQDFEKETLDACRLHPGPYVCLSTPRRAVDSERFNLRTISASLSVAHAYGRIVAFRILADRLGKDVSLDPRPIDPDLLKEAKRVLNLSASGIERASNPAGRKVKLKRNHPES